MLASLQCCIILGLDEPKDFQAVLHIHSNDMIYMYNIALDISSAAPAASECAGSFNLTKAYGLVSGCRRSGPATRHGASPSLVDMLCLRSIGGSYCGQGGKTLYSGKSSITIFFKRALHLLQLATCLSTSFLIPTAR